MEVGTQAQKETLIREFYPKQISHPRYIKGVFGGILKKKWYHIRIIFGECLINRSVVKIFGSKNNLAEGLEPSRHGR